MNKLVTVMLSCLLAVVSPAHADQLDPRLDDLFRQLKSTSDARQAGVIEAQIWQAWVAHDNSEYAQLMMTGIEQMNRNALGAALATFNQLIQNVPDFAEAWNKRATLHYLMRNFEASEADIRKTLELEPFHFGALSGLGLVYLGQGRYEQARNAFNDALEVNPHMSAVRSNVEQLEDYLRSRII